MSRAFDIRDDVPMVIPAHRAIIPLALRADSRSAAAPRTPHLDSARRSSDEDLVSEALAFAAGLSSAQGLGQDSTFGADPIVMETSAGAKAIGLQHEYLGIPVFQSTMVVRFDPGGELRDAASRVAAEPDLVEGRTSVSVVVAVKTAAEFTARPHPDDVDGPDTFGTRLTPPSVDVHGFRPHVRTAADPRDPARTTVLDAGPFGEPIRASLTWFPYGTRLALAWQVRLVFPDHADAYAVIVDAGTGRVLYSRSETYSIAAAGWVHRRDGDGDRELVSFPLPWNEYPLTSAAVGQSGWSRCGRCGLLVHLDARSGCAGGGVHDVIAGETYAVVRNSPRYSGEGDWRHCVRCSGLFRRTVPGVCGAGGPHADGGDGDYALLKDAPLAIGSTGWQRCARCGGLVKGDLGPAHCPAGGTHLPSADAEYVLPWPGTLAESPREWADALQLSGYTTTVAPVAGAKAPVADLVGGLAVHNPSDPLGYDQAQLNLFYYCCYMHDAMYLLGFRESERNFQSVNFGLGGVGNDPVKGQAFSEPIPSTAALIPRPEGQSPLMKAGTTTGAARHTALDASVIFHEFFHGVSHRLVGGVNNDSALTATQSAAMGEGWSDFVACTLCGVDVVAAWAMKSSLGIRRFRYNSQFPDGFAALGTGRYLSEPHNIGEIWAAALMEMARNTDSGLALQLVVDALKLTKPLPSFLDGRDAILLALENLLQARRISARQHAGAWLGVWMAFAKFGMGPDATSPGPRTNGIQGDNSLGEPGWTRCLVCSGALAPASPSRCVAGSRHRPDATAYEVLRDHPESCGRSGWRPCGACGLLFLPAVAGGSCWAGGSHQDPGAGTHTLIDNAVGPAGEQGWKQCEKCSAAFASQGKSLACPSGGVHKPVTVGDYRMIRW
jgi:hypothetical protein